MRFSPAPRVYKLMTLVHAWRREECADLFPQEPSETSPRKDPPPSTVHASPQYTVQCPGGTPDRDPHTHWVPRARNPGEGGVAGLEGMCP